MSRNLFIFIWVIFLFGSARERMCTRVTKLNWDSIEVAAKIIDSNNRYVRSRRLLRVTIHASQEENQRNFPLTSLVWLPRLILALRVCRWRNSQTCRRNFESSQRNFRKIIEILKYFQSYLSKIVNLGFLVVEKFVWKLPNFSLEVRITIRSLTLVWS